MQISKSEYMMYLKHPAWLWLKKHNKKILPPPDKQLQALFDAGNEFERYAQRLFSDGVTLGFNSYDEYLSLPQRTADVLKSGATTIFQGRLEAGDTTCIFDVLRRVEGNTFDLWEIKSSTSVKPEHVLDLAFQVAVLEGAGLIIRKCAVVHVNNQYERHGDIDVQEITTTTDVTEDVRSKKDFTELHINKALASIASNEMPDPSPRYVRLGAMDEWMEIYEALKGKVAADSIFNVIALGAKKIGDLEDLGVARIDEIPDDFELTVAQQRQVMAVKANSRMIDRAAISDFLSTLQFPLHFFDYETFSSVLPAFDGLRPYQQVAFQYSLHTLAHADAAIEHREYLHTENSNPVATLVAQMRRDFGTRGTVIAWSKSFEMGRNTEMAAMMPEHRAFLEDINARVIDLGEPFKQGMFIDKAFNGSWSIKSVLPVLVPDLTYDDLAVRNGGDATFIWSDTFLRGNNGGAKQKIADDLRQYCALDTFAMYAIWKVLLRETSTKD